MEERGITISGGGEFIRLFNELLGEAINTIMEQTEEQRQEAELNRILLSMRDESIPATLPGNVRMEKTGELILNTDEPKTPPQHTEDKVTGYACRHGLRLIEEGQCDNCICKQWRH